MGQGYIQSNPPHVVSWLHLLKTAIVQDPIILLFVNYAISILMPAAFAQLQPQCHVEKSFLKLFCNTMPIASHIDVDAYLMTSNQIGQ